ncbi:hypothetical protein RV12_GL000677 [Enterococcus quebecensis]|nr:hypothetical protein RV12_GL000677 [Enterococcus quebecensis]
MMNESEINVALITDKNYFIPAIATIKSMLANTNRTVNVKCILTEVVENELNELVDELENKYQNSKIDFLYFDDSILSHVKPKWHISRAAYVKIYLPSILSNWETCIFLDSDLLVKEDIGLLWDEFQNNGYGKELAAVWNPGYNKDNEVMGLEEDEKTFNSGIMVMNLNSMRKQNATEKLEKFIKEFNHVTLLNDQAAFNAVYKREWLELPLKWNVQFLFFAKRGKEIGIEKQSLEQLKKNPAIVHFTTSSKPWKFRSVHPFKKEYLPYYLSVENSTYQGKVSFIDVIKRVREIFLFAIGKI